MGLGLPIGLLLGVATGRLAENLALWLSLGTAVGLVVDVAAGKLGKDG